MLDIKLIILNLEDMFQVTEKDKMNYSIESF